MNQVNNHLKLALPTIFLDRLGPLVTLVLLGFVVLVSASDGSDNWLYTIAFSLVAIGHLMGYRPDATPYRTLNLTSKVYSAHFRVGLTIHLFFIAAFLLPTLWLSTHQRWAYAALVVLAVYVLQLWTSATLPESGSETLRQRAGFLPLEKEPSDERTEIADLAKELITRPQRNFWWSMWAGIAAFTLIWLLLTTLWGDGGGEVGALSTGILFAVIISTAGGTVAETLTNWVTFGGNRTTWARHTRWVMLLTPLLALAVSLFLWATGILDDVTAAVLLFVTLSLVSVISALLQMTTWNTAGYLMAVLGLLAVGLVGLANGAWWLYAGLGLLSFVGYEILLPRIARAYNPFSGGLRGFFGLQRQAA